MGCPNTAPPVMPRTSAAVERAPVSDEVDAVIRVNPRPDSELVGRCFLRNQLVLVAPPGLPRPVDARPDVPDRFPAVMRTGSSHDEAWPFGGSGNQRADPADALCFLLV